MKYAHYQPIQQKVKELMLAVRTQVSSVIVILDTNSMAVLPVTFNNFNLHTACYLSLGFFYSVLAPLSPIARFYW